MTPRIEPARLLDLSGKVIAITGGAGMLAGAFARSLCRAGARVALLDRSEEGVTTRVRELTSEGAPDSIAIVVDLTDEAAVDRAFAAITERTSRLDGLVNNAATKSSHFYSRLEALPADEWRQVLDVNLTAMFLCAKAAIPHLRAAGGGTITNIGSIYGLVSPDPRIYDGLSIETPAVYSASKAGVFGLTRYIAAYHAPDGIRCNMVTPGGVSDGTQSEEFVRRYSARVPMARMALANEIAAAVLFLTSDASSYVTGHNLVVDGGLTAW